MFYIFAKHDRNERLSTHGYQNKTHPSNLNELIWETDLKKNPSRNSHKYGTKFSSTRIGATNTTNEIFTSLQTRLIMSAAPVTVQTVSIPLILDHMSKNTAIKLKKSTLQANHKMHASHRCLTQLTMM